MIVLGIDPGIHRLGYAFIESVRSQLTPISYGLITTDAKEDKAQRILQIYNDLSELIDKYNPNNICIESLIFARNVTTAMMISEVRGAVILLSAQRKIPVIDMTPLQIKSAVAGYGKADKKQIQNAVTILLNLKEVPKPDDIADALAIAICGVGNLEYYSKIY